MTNRTHISLVTKHLNILGS